MRFDEVYFLELSHVHRAHADAMQFGLPDEDPGILGEGLIESAVMAPRNSYAQSLAELASIYLFGIAQNHGYQNANKRTAVVAMALFLEMNGYPIDPPWQHWVTMLTGVATSALTRGSVTYEIARLMGGDVPIHH